MRSRWWAGFRSLLYCGNRESRPAAPWNENFSNELTLRVSCAFAASRNPFILGKTRILVKLSAETRASGSKPPSLPRERPSSDLDGLFSYPLDHNNLECV